MVDTSFLFTTLFFYVYFLKIYFIDCAITVVPFFFSPLFPSALYPPPIIIPSPYIYILCTYKFFGFYISHTVLNLPLSILYLPFMLLIPCTFSPILPLPTDNPPWDLHFCESIPVHLFSSFCFCFCFFRFGC